MPPLYDPEAVRPMWEELANVGVMPLHTPDEVDEILKDDGTALVVVNSVCGCAAGGCRPGVTLALQNDTIPDRLATVFAGVDTEATARAREYMNFSPSSPNVVLFKGGKPVFALERRHIERMTAVEIATTLQNAFNEHCSAKGPSVAPEVFQDNKAFRTCGSKIPLYQGD